MAEAQDETKGTTLELKDALVFIPLIGTAIAVSFDVGYFWGIDINFFTLFSITEHIVFALQAAPMAFAIAILLVAFLGTRAHVVFGDKIEAAGKRVRSKYLLIALSVVPILVLLVAIYFRLIAAVISAVAGVFIALFQTLPFSQKTTYLIAGSLMMIAAFALGHDFGHTYVSYGKGNHSIQVDKELSPTPLLVKIIRSGDRGVLYYEPATKQLGFLRWDAIKKLTSPW